MRRTFSIHQRGVHLKRTAWCHPSPPAPGVSRASTYATDYGLLTPAPSGPCSPSRPDPHLKHFVAWLKNIGPMENTPSTGDATRPSDPPPPSPPPPPPPQQPPMYHNPSPPPPPPSPPQELLI